MDLKQMADLLFLLLVIIVVAVTVIRVIKKRAESIHSPEDLIEYLTGIMSDKIVPFITKIAMKEELEDCTSYDDFKEKCEKKFTDEIYNIITDPNVSDGFDIPDFLMQFVTKENIGKVVHRALYLTEVDDYLNDVYMKLVQKKLVAMEEFEKETAEYNARVGVEDNETLEKEDLGIGKPKEDDTGYTDVSESLSDDVATEPYQE